MPDVAYRLIPCEILEPARKRTRKYRHGTHYRHGTNACYTLDCCGCGPCRKAGAAYRRELASSEPRMVDAEPVRRHVWTLIAQGMSTHRVQLVSGVSGSSIQGLLYGRKDRGDGSPVTKLRRATAERLLATRLTALTPFQVIKGEVALQAWEMIADLMGLGYSRAWIAARVIGPKAVGLQIGKSSMEARHIVAIRKLWETTVEPREATDRQIASAISRSRNGARVLRNRIAARRAYLARRAA